MNEEQKKTEEKEKVCPFSSKDLKCEDCRLFQAYPGSQGQRLCVFIRMAD